MCKSDFINDHAENPCGDVPDSKMNFIEENVATCDSDPMNDKGELDLNKFSKILSKRTKVVFVNHVSNALGTVNDIEKIINLSHNVGASVLIDGAQAVPHFKVDVSKLDVDFYVCSRDFNEIIAKDVAIATFILRSS